MRLVRCVGLVLLSGMVGCFGGRWPQKIRGSGEPLPLPKSVAEAPPLIVPPPPPIPAAKVRLSGQTDSDSPLHRLTLTAINAERRLDNYMVRMRRRELVDGKNPDEIILMKYRRTPLSIHLKWLGPESQGREIVYVTGQHDNKIHLRTGKGDLFGSGRRLSFAPDSPLVRSKSHYPVTEVGLGAATQRFASLLAAVDRRQTNAGSVRYLGLVQRPEFNEQVEGVEQIIPAGLEPFLPRGGLRRYYFDAAMGVPSLIITFDPNGQEVEYYHFDRLQVSVNLDDEDFDPDKLWGRPTEP